ncbi:tRNA-dihydrouridine synthase [Carboxylicivirga mesophila]|uniref:tRNA-dihydrouridine synthase n=1 Tax=Carboxylicivirga mesophila TaxID=1166478 RepID=A0ABS5K873_9BACT|nr:tRNA-dihydrouridine synthase [Carboxylicivirga mesophila]MBS2211159.1 tRNA-dihydrouridine synthase [Carboxylicivirga mesophila]
MGERITTNKTNYWKTSEGPIWALAPMEDVTDTVFREVVLRLSSPGNLHLLFSEFLSTDGFCHPVGKEKVVHRFHVNDSELELIKRDNVKLVAQIWGTDPEKFYKTAKYIAEETAFDGIDINMGCPMKNIIKKGACSALINTPELAREIITAVHEASDLPLSVKTRVGFKSVVTESWISNLLQSEADAIIVHGRIQKMMSEGEADWNEIARSVELRNQINPDIKLLGNGDVMSIEESLDKVMEYGVDGVMVGRGIFHNPWFYNPAYSPAMEERIEALRLHASLYANTWQGVKPWSILKRFFKIYTNSFPGAVQLRAQLMETHGFDEVEQILNDFLLEQEARKQAKESEAEEVQ